ncbi:MAG TPA: DUF4212 domain-containing protein [Leptolyngbyaceae cyanobacterium M33_DOE_097]|uniref:DUF4212 domain-containing protein n=1 Tax=Oscillatoriales cyanobacterium SpSt-418 TaxID=2282169 RepID=A0A7C3KDE7_9CYAN|nr:DUF4212 domain-containing protein [Leptolyngbyaceae cyanobacterium M33_DOE_097]
MNETEKRAYWRANTTLIRSLLIVWAIVSVGLSILLVQFLNTINLGQVPLGFWMAQQGSIYVFVVLIFIYANRMDKIDRTYLKNNSAPLTPEPESSDLPE